jgi:hypothetical protein
MRAQKQLVGWKKRGEREAGPQEGEHSKRGMGDHRRRRNYSQMARNDMIAMHYQEYQNFLGASSP